MDWATGEVHKLAKENETNMFPVWTEQASSIKFLSLWLYFKFPDGTAHLIGDNVHTTKDCQENLLLLHHFRRMQNFGQTTKKGFYLTPKCFRLNFFSRTQISEFSS